MTYDNGKKAQLCGHVQGGVALVRKIWVLQDLAVVLDDALDQEEIVEVNGSLEADGGVNHDISLCACKPLRQEANTYY